MWAVWNTNDVQITRTFPVSYKNQMSSVSKAKWYRIYALMQHVFEHNIKFSGI